MLQGILGAVDTAAPGQKRMFNLGNTQPHTVSHFVSLLESALGKEAIKHYQELPRLGDVLKDAQQHQRGARGFWVRARSAP